MKRQFIIPIAFFALAIIMGVCSCDDRTTKEKADHAKQRDEGYYKGVVAYEIKYVYDPRTDICYAITQEQHGHGLYRTMTVVPYEKVKDQALVVEYKGMDAEYWERFHKRNSTE